MTTIDEENMDEFFNFGDAANPLDPNEIDLLSNLASFPCDLDLEFAAENHGNSFMCPPHCSAPEDPLSFELHNAALTDTTMMGPDDFTDFPRWIDGMDVPSDPCAYCRRMRIHCKVIKEGLRKGSCTSCVALARSCSLTDPGPSQLKNDSNRCTESFCLPGNAVDTEESDDWPEFSNMVLECCERCCHAGFECVMVKEGDNAGACTNCVAFSESCSFTTHQNLDYWKLNDGTNTLLPLEPSDSLSRCASGPNLASLKSSDENMNASLALPPKVGARFSRESLRILRNWLNTHSNHPYPTDEEKETLRRQTGLNKTQITNWLANARRRGKVRPPRSTSPAPRNYSNAMDIPRRAGTPGIENMNPLERWQHSPPEHEPASVTAIAKAVTSSSFASGMDSPYTNYGHTDDGSSRSLCNVSSTSSLGTSHSSGGSFASAFSHKSRGSFGSFGSFGNRGRRRRRRQAPKPVKVESTPARTFQCTFCTETFKTKHDWQRHEKSLHLSLERWVCCPNGPAQFCADYNHNRCVFCGLPNPPPEHAEIHNYSSCADRNLGERTFYRKDHLRQHLNLVHDVKFQTFSMETWKVSTPEIRSRCGFCGIVMDSWSIRVDHLADHFKRGKSMADWKGDWGFEAPILDLVENGMPPYLIHDERNSMSPYEASKATEKTKTSYDVIKISLVEYLQERVVRGGAPTDDDLLREARDIISKTDEFTDTFLAWFRDLLMLYGIPEDDELAFPSSSMLCNKRLEEIAAAQANHKPSDLAAPKYNSDGKLGAFVYSKQMLGLTPTDRELQVECCKVLDDLEMASNYLCKGALDWFKYLVTSETCWLREFRKRCGLPRSSEMAFEHIRSSDDKSIDYGIHNFRRLERELKDWARFQMALGKPPTDADIQRQARLIVYKNDDPWNQTEVDDPAILHVFKRQTGLAPLDIMGVDCLDLPSPTEGNETGLGQRHNPFETNTSPKTLHWDLEQTGRPIVPSPSNGGQSSGVSPTSRIDQPLHTLIQNQPSTNTNPTQPLKYFLNDANCYGRLVRELTRFVTACMSPNNPNQHVPTDAEIQNHARWVIYDDDDPWNQTAADNAEWLIRFKRDVGLAPESNGPGLPFDSKSWNTDLGGSGFAPPYINPKEPRALNIAEEEQGVKVKVGDGRYYSVKARTAKGFAGSMKGRWQEPGKIFCSRELEQGLGQYVTSELSKGMVPTDEALKAKAKEILGLETTAADDAQLLEKFKILHGIPPVLTLTASSSKITTPTSQLEQELASIDSAMLADFDDELGNMDLSGLELPSTRVDHMDLLIEPQLPLSSANAQASPLHGEKGVMNDRVAMDYAELYRVRPATASPLQRRASERMAEARGFRLPAIETPSGPTTSPKH